MQFDKTPHASQAAWLNKCERLEYENDLLQASIDTTKSIMFTRAYIICSPTSTFSLNTPQGIALYLIKLAQNHFFFIIHGSGYSDQSPLLFLVKTTS